MNLESSPTSKPSTESKGLWYEFRKGIVVGLGAALVILPINVPATIFITQYVTEHAKSAVARRSVLRPKASEVTNQLSQGHSLFYPEVEIWNPGPRTAVGAKILIRPAVCAIRLERDSVSIFPAGDNIDFQETRDTTSDCEAHILTIPRLRSGQRLTIRYAARSTEYIPTAAPLKLLKVEVQDCSYNDLLSEVLPTTEPSVIYAYTDADAAGNHFAARGRFTSQRGSYYVIGTLRPAQSAPSANWTDSSVPLLALVDAAALGRARTIADPMLYAQANDQFFSDGHVRNAYQAGDIALLPSWMLNKRSNTVRMPGWYDAGRSTWFEDKTQVITRGGGIIDGYDGWENGAVTGKSTEHNIDLYSPFSTFLSRGRQRVKFWTGTTEDGITSGGAVSLNVEALNNGGADLRVQSTVRGDVNSDGVPNSLDVTVLDAGGAKLFVTTRVRQRRQSYDPLSKLACASAKLAAGRCDDHIARQSAALIVGARDGR